MQRLPINRTFCQDYCFTFIAVLMLGSVFCDEAFAQPRPDLAVNLGGAPQLSLCPGDVWSVTVSPANAYWALATSPSTKVDLYLSQDPRFFQRSPNANDIKVIQLDVPPLEIGESKNFLLKITIPDVPLGTIWYPFAVVDPENQVDELNEGNNVSAGGYFELTVPITCAPIVLAPPSLSSPRFGASEISTNPMLVWNKVAGATTYRVQVLRYFAFAPVVDASDISDTSHQVSGLQQNTIYDWKVSASNVTLTSPWSTIWRFTTVSTMPSTPILASPTNNATGVSIRPTFNWNPSVEGATYRLQVSTTPTFTTLIVDLQGTRFTSYPTDPTHPNNPVLVLNTTYFWRVNASTPVGTSTYSDTWTFTTLSGPPLAPTLSSPSNASSNHGTDVDFSWISSAEATGYHFQLSNDSTFSSVLRDISNPAASLGLSLLSMNTTYFWRVSAFNSAGQGPWSEVWRFTTAPATQPSIPISPSLLSPPNESLNLPVDPTLIWSNSSGATSYRLQVSNVISFSSLIIDQSNIPQDQGNSNQTGLQVANLLGGIKYYWRVNASNTRGTSEWSSVWSFTTVGLAPTIPATPSLISPPSGATGVSIDPTFSWSLSPGATSYRLQIATDQTFSAIVFDANTAANSQQIFLLTHNTVYYWRVSATNGSGTSSFSTTWSFTTIGVAPSAPTLASPLNGATAVSTSPTLSWNASTGATSYRLQISTSSSFSSLTYDQSGITDTLRQVSGLASNTLYYWRANATNAGGTSPYSSTWTFTTIVTAPVAPSLTSPLNGATGVSVNPTFVWNASSGATDYRLQISINSNFPFFVFDGYTGTDTSKQFYPLSESTTYYWRVNATNDGGISDWSPTWSFTTITAAPTAPTLLSPNNGATGLSTNPTLSWSGSTRATSYRLQVSPNSSFSSLTYDQSGITDTLRQVSGLANNTLYYWRVNATNIGGTSSYSSTWNFTTRPVLAVANPFTIPALTDVSPVFRHYLLSPPLIMGNVGPLRFTASLENPVIASVSISNDTLILSKKVTGATTVTVTATDAADNSSITYITSFNVVTMIETILSNIPTTFTLEQNYPNPFNPITTIEFAIPKQTSVLLTIFNSLGVEIEVLVNRHFSPGHYQIQWVPNNSPSGVYFYQFKAAEFIDTKKLLLLR